MSRERFEEHVSKRKVDKFIRVFADNLRLKLMKRGAGGTHESLERFNDKHVLLFLKRVFEQQKEEKPKVDLQSSFEEFKTHFPKHHDKLVDYIYEVAKKHGIKT
ncbi:MAG: hypothetical protein ACE5DI_06495 [Candidatus Micrarchaeia archaeon]